MVREWTYEQLQSRVRKLKRDNRRLLRSRATLRDDHRSLSDSFDQLLEENAELRRQLANREGRTALAFMAYFLTLIVVGILSYNLITGLISLADRALDNSYSKAMAAMDLTRELAFNETVGNLPTPTPEATEAPVMTATPAPAVEIITWVQRDWTDTGYDLAAGSTVQPGHLVGFYTSGDSAVFLPVPEVSGETHPLVVDGLSNMQLMFWTYDEQCNSIYRPAANGDWGYLVRLRDTLNNADASWRQDGVPDVFVFTNDYERCGQYINLDYRHP